MMESFSLPTCIEEGTNLPTPLPTVAVCLSVRLETAAIFAAIGKRVKIQSLYTFCLPKIGLYNNFLHYNQS